MTEKISAIGSEMVVIGSMINSKEARNIAFDFLKGSYFYRNTHREIFETLKNMDQQDMEIDLVSLTQELMGKPKFKQNPAYINKIYEYSNPGNVEHHARIIIQKYMLRKAALLATNFLNKIPEVDKKGLTQVRAEEFISGHIEDLYRILEIDIKGGAKIIGPVMIEEYLKFGKKKNKLVGLPTGLPTLDRLTGGFQNGNMIILAGRPSQGKSNLALFFLRYLALREKQAVLLFSLEMTKEALVRRIISAELDVDSSLMRIGELEEEIYTRISQFIKNHLEDKFFIDDSGGLTISQIRARAKKAVSNGVKMVAIDYLGLVLADQKFGSKYQEITFLSQKIKELGKILRVPLLAVTQLNRAPDERKDNKPRLSDLRDSGALEQDGDLIMLIHRPLKEETDDQSKMELILAKQREGPRGKVDIYFNEKSGKIWEIRDVEDYSKSS